MSENENKEKTGKETAAQASSKPAKESKEKKSKNKKDEKVGFFQRIGRWAREMKSELKKVVWPTPIQTAKNTITVVSCVLLVGVFIWVFDWLAAEVIGALLNLFGKM